MVVESPVGFAEIVAREGEKVTIRLIDGTEVDTNPRSLVLADGHFSAMFHHEKLEAVPNQPVEAPTELPQFEITEQGMETALGQLIQEDTKSAEQTREFVRRRQQDDIRAMKKKNGQSKRKKKRLNKRSNRN